MSVVAVRVGIDGTVSEIDLGQDTGAGLRAAIECRGFDVVRLAPGLDMWIDDEGLFTADPVVNTVATAIAWAYGFVWQKYVGVAVFASSDDEGETVSLPDAYRSALVDAARELSALHAAGVSV
ncbi:DUF3846 domain-containing protein [Rhodococcus sp. DSM 6344]|nr:DUF3846 domain-containing protein [Rhodococcus erythropolis]